ncbi:hypothetical protein [Pararhodobacter sp. SW119]|uniref:hypothetical protein n=1 Tax=Pararhodobacter sp. SW119 TaxID=2780075 RepID=UPI001AE0DE9D|nr:hypothetical protein [Pararhodobacter sp. SW119]
MLTAQRFAEAEVEAAYQAALQSAKIERHRVHVFPHPVWDHGERVQLHVYEDPQETPDFFVEFNEPLSDAFRAGLGKVMAALAALHGTPEGDAAEAAMEIEFEGFWMSRERIEESFMKRMLVVTGWHYVTRDGQTVQEGFA